MLRVVPDVTDESICWLTLDKCRFEDRRLFARMKGLSPDEVKSELD